MQSEDSATCTTFSDQRSENDDESCPCDACVQTKQATRPAFPTEVLNDEPSITDIDLKNVLESTSEARKPAPRPGGDMARLLVAVNSVILLLFGSDMFLVGASEYQRNTRIYASIQINK
ncbi:unnamed protein product [Tetraodon nigroviridis]|uniref:(spotted green pufferfish) hypothetical protein n=1 Tax=Tetraodon nigroviridis TaxID=99883 RepID=Q4RR71_TETNG|nr:unnamed protein product [Tetraodon nigroviridis]